MPAGSTYEPIATTTLSSSQATVTFSGITGSYTDLVIALSGRTDRSTGIDELKMRLNSDTGSNYSRTRLITITSSSSAYSDRASNETSFVQGVLACASANFAASTFSPYFFNINNYSNTTTFKTVLQRYSEAQNEYGVGTAVGLYRSTSAITSIEFSSAYSANFVSGSIFTLYGIAAA
jgi:hypothetical protein